MKRFVFISIFFIISFAASAKLSIIHIKETLVDAKTIRLIIVIGYNDSMMLYRLENSTDTLQADCRVKFVSEPFRLSLIEKKVLQPNDLAGKWPEAGEKVLLVVNKRNRVVLFAKWGVTDYRFWDPNSIPFANSRFFIPAEQFYKPLPTCGDLLPKGAHDWMCTDGCLVSVFAIVQRG